VQIIDRQQCRLLQGHVGRKPVEAMDDREGALRSGVLSTGRLRGSQQRLDERGRPGEQLRAELRRNRREQRLEQLPDDPVGELALKLAAAGRKYAHPRRVGNRAPLGDQARLAEAGSALDDDKPPTAAPSRLSQRPQSRNLDLTLQKQAGSARRNDTRQRHHDQSTEPRSTDSLEARLGLTPTRGGPVQVQTRQHRTRSTERSAPMAKVSMAPTCPGKAQRTRSRTCLHRSPT
jgi:hypothetical protein